MLTKYIKYSDEEYQGETGEYFENDVTKKVAPNAFKDKADMIQKMKDDPSSLGMQLHRHQHRTRNSGSNLCLVSHGTKDFSHHGKGRDLSSVPTSAF